MWSVIWEEIKTSSGVVGDAEHPDHWKVSVDGVAAGPVTHVPLLALACSIPSLGKVQSTKPREPTAQTTPRFVLTSQGRGCHMAVSTRRQPAAC